MSESAQMPRAIWIGITLTLALLALAFLASVSSVVLKQNRLNLPVIGTVADFTLTNQDGQATSLAQLTNHVWVGDIIFTRCAGPCPRITAQMRELQVRLKDSPTTRFVTLTTDPDNDSSTVLKRYGEHVGADFRTWSFLTGTKAQIAGLAGDSLKLSAVPVPSDQRKDDADLFIHSTIFVLVDQHARLRGVFETGGDGVDWTNVVEPRLVRAIHQLEKYPEP